MDSLERARPSRLRLLLALIVGVVMIGLIAHGNYAGSGDAVHYMVAARSIAFDRDLDVGNDYADPARIVTEPPGGHAQPGVDGVLRPVHDVGFPLIAAPFFGAAYLIANTVDRWPAWFVRRAKLNKFIVLRQLLSLFMIAVTAALAILFFDTSWRLTSRKAPAFLWTLVWTLSPPILSLGYVFMTEIPSALIALWIYARRDDLSGERPARRGLMLGLLTGLLFLIHVRNIGVMLALGAMVLWRVRHKPAQGISFVAGLAVMGALKVAINLRFWGTPLTNPHEHLGVWPGLATFLSDVTVSFFGLLFDARHGLLFAAPIFLLAPAAWLILKRHSRSAAWELLLLAGAYLIFVINPVTNIHGWQGGWSPAARFLVPIAPFLAVAVPVLFSSWKTVRIAAVVLIVQLPISAYLWGHPMQQWSEGPGPAAFLQALAGSSIAAAVPSWEQMNESTWTMLAIALTIWGALTWALVGSAQDQLRRSKVDVRS